MRVTLSEAQTSGTTNERITLGLRPCRSPSGSGPPAVLASPVGEQRTARKPMPGGGGTNGASAGGGPSSNGLVSERRLSRTLLDGKRYLD